MHLFNRLHNHKIVRQAITEKEPDSPILHHPLLLIFTEGKIANAMTTAAQEDEVLATAIDDSGSADEKVAAGGVQGLLQWILDNWGTISGIIADILKMFHLGAEPPVMKAAVKKKEAKPEPEDKEEPEHKAPKPHTPAHPHATLPKHHK